MSSQILKIFALWSLCSPSMCDLCYVLSSFYFQLCIRCSLLHFPLSHLAYVQSSPWPRSYKNPPEISRVPFSVALFSLVTVLRFPAASSVLNCIYPQDSTTALFLFLFPVLLWGNWLQTDIRGLSRCTEGLYICWAYCPVSAVPSYIQSSFMVTMRKGHSVSARSLRLVEIFSWRLFLRLLVLELQYTLDIWRTYLQTNCEALPFRVSDLVIWLGAQQSAFLTCVQVMLMLMVWEPNLEHHWFRKMDLEKKRWALFGAYYYIRFYSFFVILFLTGLCFYNARNLALFIQMLIFKKLCILFALKKGFLIKLIETENT